MHQRQERTTVAQRWANAFRRARDEAIRVRQVNHSGAYVADSASDPGQVYEVTPTSCTCLSGSHDQPCKHVAALMLHLAREAALAVERAGWDANDRDVNRALSRWAWLEAHGLTGGEEPLAA